ncbi:hypothetical protein [Cereibacter sphaeroides]|uniref:hypothetical protein n=1 Tax=Cereibacter sphaeroides TaxID=1063 RepID=UPI003FCE2026
MDAPASLSALPALCAAPFDAGRPRDPEIRALMARVRVTPAEARALGPRRLSPTDFPSAGALRDALPLALTDRKDPR